MTPTLGDIFRAHGEDYLTRATATLSKAQRIALVNIATCRTPALGTHLYICSHCEDKRLAYDSCRDRHCPACLAGKSREWLRERMTELLPVPYFHMVFTVPEEVAALALGNKALLYDALLRASADTLLAVARKRLNARLGFLSVLHTWSQTLQHHPHVHCVVPGGGLSLDWTTWIPARSETFFLPVAVLSKVFRAKLTDRLQRYFRNGKLEFAGTTAHLHDPDAFQRWLIKLRKLPWVVYAKAPFGSPSHVLRYLAAYTHRVAIGNKRIIRFDEKTVTFRYRDRKLPERHRCMTLSAEEFIRRFLLHVLPQNFVRIRYYGFLGNPIRQDTLAHCRTLLGATDDLQEPQLGPSTALPDSQGEVRDGAPCTRCKLGYLSLAASVGPRPFAFRIFFANLHLPDQLPPRPHDTS